ncbi:MAG TPA: VWA domain-containing protein [candidate division Zixibacteria bacterium]|nr:VWA domain-containing protein [candidate division Zixibacteria bacterium]
MIGDFINRTANVIFGPLVDGFLDFASPWWFLLIPVVLALFVWRRRRRGGSLRYSNVGLLKGARPSARVMIFGALAWLELFGLIFLSLAAARPRAGSVRQTTFTEGIDIMIVLDISGSMRALDFKPKNRIEASKMVAGEFIKGRSNDRIGLVVFAGRAFTQCPLTLDYGVLLEFLDGVEIGQIEDGTAIGTAIATGADRLRDSSAKSKVIILLTDGVNNRGEIDPMTAAQLAKALGIKVYTIGAGRPGHAMFPVEDPIFGTRHVRMDVEIDEESLTQIASLTGGQYFRATDTDGLRKIFGEIDQMEKTKIEVDEFTQYRELFPFFLVIGALLLLADIFLSNTLFRKLP